MRSQKHRMLAGEPPDPAVPAGGFAAGNPCRVIRRLASEPAEPD